MILVSTFLYQTVCLKIYVKIIPFKTCIFRKMWAFGAVQTWLYCFLETKSCYNPAVWLGMRYTSSGVSTPCWDTTGASHHSLEEWSLNNRDSDYPQASLNILGSLLVKVSKIQVADIIFQQGCIVQIVQTDHTWWFSELISSFHLWLCHSRWQCIIFITKIMCCLPDTLSSYFIFWFEYSL